MRCFNVFTNTSFQILGLTFAVMVMISACATSKTEKSKPIENPFGNFYPEVNRKYQPMVLRSKKADRSVEVELPQSGSDMTDFVVPMSPQFKDFNNQDDGDGIAENADAKSRRSTFSDREIASTFKTGGSEEQIKKQKQLEEQMGLIPSSDDGGEKDHSYLAGMDKAKILFKKGRFEASLLEIDSLLKAYPTSAKLYEMRGTLLDRLGHEDLALRSWKQALEIDSNNRTLRTFVAKREKNKQARGGVNNP
jgi:tetratricopeptide (TPR) repeat protein